MNGHRYILASNKFPKPDCPYCGAKKHWQRYIDIETGEVLSGQYGLCDNANKCGQGLNPYTDGYAKIICEQEQGGYSGNMKPRTPPQPKPTPKPERVFFPKEVLQQTLRGYEQNVFIQNLLHQVQFPFEAQDVESVVSQYYLGTVCNGYMAGAITFPYIDIVGNVRAIQVKKFNQANHTTGTDFLHSIIEKNHLKKNEALPGWLEAYQKNDIKVSCLFGEHLLSKYPLNPIALVEAPKTAVYDTLYFGFPDNPKNLLWLAVYNLSSLNFEKCKALKGREVYLFPDLSKNGKAYELWSSRSKELSQLMPGTSFEVSDLLETLAPNELRKDGADIADVLIKMDWRKFRTRPIEVKTEQPQPEHENHEKYEAPERNYFLQLDKNPLWDIDGLETYFAGAKLPIEPVKMNQFSTITDIQKFIQSHLSTVKANNGNPTFQPYFERLETLKAFLNPN